MSIRLIRSWSFPIAYVASLLLSDVSVYVCSGRENALSFYKRDRLKRSFLLNFLSVNEYLVACILRMELLPLSHQKTCLAIAIASRHELPPPLPQSSIGSPFIVVLRAAWAVYWRSYLRG